MAPERVDLVGHVDHAFVFREELSDLVDPVGPVCLVDHAVHGVLVDFDASIPSWQAL